MLELVLSGHMGAKTVIVGINAVKTAHGAGWPITEDMAIGSLAGRTQIVNRTLLEALLVVYVMMTRSAVVAAECCWIILNDVGSYME
jgi:hypothetical protein